MGLTGAAGAVRAAGITAGPVGDFKTAGRISTTDLRGTLADAVSAVPSARSKRDVSAIGGAALGSGRDSTSIFGWTGSKARGATGMTGAVSRAFTGTAVAVEDVAGNPADAVCMARLARHATSAPKKYDDSRSRKVCSSK